MDFSRSLPSLAVLSREKPAVYRPILHKFRALFNRGVALVAPHLIFLRSPRFWAQVERILPDYRERRKWLKEKGSLV